MPTKRCAWGQCNSDSRYKDASHMQGVSFVPFPKPKTNLEKCMLWVKLCGRPYEQLNPSLIKRHTHYVCTKHFIDGQSDPVPASPFDKMTPKRKRPAERSEPACSIQPKKPLLQPESETCATTSQMDYDNVPSTDILDNDTTASVPQPAPPQSVNGDAFISQSVQTEKHNTFIETILSSDKMCFYYTGLPTVELLNCLFEWILPAATKTKLWDGERKHIPGRKGGRKRNNFFNEYILTLVKIRHGYGTQHLVYLFTMSSSQVCRVFSTWVNLLDQCLKPLLIWPSKDMVRANLPASFAKYPNTRAIIDCTEYFVQKPLKPVAQKLTWSNYKHANTFKQLVAISPIGTIIFVSNLYSGSISDVSIVKESKMLDLVEPGDDIMADRGFNIRHLLLPKRATLNIPAFSHGKTLSKKAVSKSRKNASVRIHVERAIRRMKTFKILSGIIPIKLRFLLPQITRIVSVICNLQPGLA